MSPLQSRFSRRLPLLAEHLDTFATSLTPSFFPRSLLYSYGCNSSDLFFTIADFAASPGTYKFLSSIAFDIMTSLRDVLPADGE